jgi:ABC-2 type transport system permease protein
LSRVLAFVRAGWLSATSYRVNAVLSLLSFAASIIPIYFIAGAIEPMMANSIAGESDQYFAFIVLGLFTQSFAILVMTSLSGAISRSVGNGHLEALLATPIRLPTLLFGLVSYELLWTIARGLLFVLAALVLGMRIAPEGIPTALLIFALLIAAHVPIGLLSVAAVLVFRNPTPIPRLMIAASAFLGGIYYPTHVVPSWLKYVSEVLPMTYGLRAFRGTLLSGAPLSSVASDFLVLVGFVAVLMPLGVLALHLSLRYARASGSLAYH